MEIEEYCRLFQKIVGLIYDKEVALKILEQYALDKRTEFIANQREKTNKKQDSPATEPQLSLIRKFMKEKKYEVKDISKLSKSEANIIIKEVLKK